MYAIEATNGQWWNAHQDGFSVAQARTEYQSIEDLPSTIGELEQEIASEPKCGGFLDIRYFAEGADEAAAGVREI